MIAEDERNHLAFTHEELLRFSARGYGELTRSMLRRYALAEIATYRDVSLAFLRRIGEELRWPRAKRALLAFGVHALYWTERLWTWRRMVSLAPPARPGAMAPRAARDRTAPTPS